MSPSPAPRRASARGAFAAVAALLGAAACSGDTPVSPATRAIPLPVVTDISVTANQTNVLALDVPVTVDGADSVRLRLRVTGEAAERVLPATIAHTGRVSLAALGLPADTSLTVRAEAMNARGAALSAPTAARTGALPAELRDVRLAITGRPTPGYILTGLRSGDIGWAVAFDSAGTIAWYHAFPEVVTVGDVQQQPNGDFTVFLGATTGFAPLPGHFVEMRPTGEVVRTYAAPDGFFTDNHELRLVGARDAVPTAYFLGFEMRPTDLTSRGGAADSLVAWHSVFRTTPDGATQRVFEAFGNFTVADWTDLPATGFGDVDHPNSIDILPNGDLLVSWRNLGQLTRIDPATGTIKWRMGGARSDFVIVDDPLGGFSGQHDARMLDDGHILLLDNGVRHEPSETRAAEYAIDEAAHTATLVWQYRHTPPRFTVFTGAVQRRVNGNTVVAYAWTGGVTEVTRDGTVVWDGQVMSGTSLVAPLYRLFKVPSLYGYRPP